MVEILRKGIAFFGQRLQLHVYTYIIEVLHELTMLSSIFLKKETLDVDDIYYLVLHNCLVSGRSKVYIQIPQA